MDINHNKVVYIHKGEHDDPHELPQQQDLEGSTEIEHTLYSHTASSSPEIDSFKNLEYIYQHFQDNEKIYESDSDGVMHETDNTLYPHIKNDIKYSLFEDVFNSCYLDSQVKDDFNCNQECYTDIQQTEHEQQLTPCTHAYDHITQHISNLDDCIQQTHCTLWKRMHHYLQVIPPHHVIITSLMVYKIQTPFQKENHKLYHQWEFICKVNINIEMSLVILTYSTMTSIMVMHSLSKTSTHHYYNRNHKTLTGAYMTLSQPKVIRYLQKWMLRQCHMQCIFQVVLRQLPKLIMSHTRQ